MTEPAATRFILLIAVSGGCIGEIVPGSAASSDPMPGAGGSNGSGPTAQLPAPIPSECRAGPIEGGPAPVRRLTREEYDNTVRDLLGDATRPAVRFQDDAALGGFHNNATSPVSSQAMARDYLGAAEDLARVAKLDAILPCKPSATAEAVCARQFLDLFGKKAWRRPLVDAEREGLVAIFLGSRARGNDFDESIRIVIATLLQAPSFLNHVERGAGAAAGASATALTPYELASRLSYLIWRSMPDAALFAAADAGQLSTPDDVEMQARRLLADRDRSRSALMSFYEQWLSLGALTSSEFADNKGKVAGFTADLGASLRNETRSFVDAVIWGGDGQVQTLLSARFSFVNAAVARLYRLPGVSGTHMRRVELPATERAGLLTQPGFLGAPGGTLTDGLTTDPIHRGLWVRQRLLCQDIPPPAGDLLDMVKPPPNNPNLTTGQRYMRMLDDGLCAGCHRLINPIGVGMENYDGMGQYRTREGSLPIDATGEVVDFDASTPRVPFKGLVDLADRLAGSPHVRDCVARQWLAFGTGAFDLGGATCNAKRLVGDFAARGGNLRDIVLSVVRNDAFRYRTPISRESCQ